MDDMALRRSIVITDPVHQVMSFGTDDKFRRLLKGVIDTFIYQRLRRISQLGLAQNVFPGATHTRFAHGLGAAFLASKAFDHLHERHDDNRAMTADARREVIAAALLHDVGHGPFSHSFEKLKLSESSKPLLPHEDWTLAAIEQEDSEIRKALTVNGLNPDNVASPFRKETGGELPKYLRQIVSSQIDVDRMDYLVRDSHFAGVALGRVDIYYLINCLTIVEHDNMSLCSLGVEEKGVKAYEGFALARQLMNRTVYFHRAVKVFEFMMEELLRHVIHHIEPMNTVPEVRAAIPPYLQAVARFCSSSMSSKDFVRQNWREYFALSEHHIWQLVTALATTESERLPSRAALLAHMILKREHLPYRQVRPEMEGVLREKLESDGYRRGEDYVLIDFSTTVYERSKDQVFVMLGKKRVEEIAAMSEILAMLRDRAERTTLLIVLDPDKMKKVFASGKAVQSLPPEDNPDS
jgi:HD superfamily phosphohydrolase